MSRFFEHLDGVDGEGEAYADDFDGVAKGFDCDCCGDRWYPVHDFNADDIWGVNMDNPNSDDFLKIYC